MLDANGEVNLKSKIYNMWFIAPLLVVFVVFFIVPTIISFFFQPYHLESQRIPFCGAL
jgi:raffinose/stachyose/melibiose transport system permease protein